MNWTFLNPWLLAFGLASLVPLILFWLRRQSPVRVEWAAMQFLQDAARDPASKRKLRQWLLLATRVALPLIVAIVVATPGCLNRNLMNDQQGTSTIHWILVFDTSASMGPIFNGTSAIDFAIDEARTHIANANRGDRFSIVDSGVESPVAVVNATADRNKALGSLDTLRVQSGTFQVGEVMNVVSALVKQIDLADQEHMQTHKAILFSDFAAADWQADSIASLTKNNERLQVQARSCGQPIPNIAITDVSAIPGVVTTGQTLDVQVRVIGTGSTTDLQANIDLVVNDRSVDRKPVTLQSGDPQTVNFEIENTLRPGTLRIEARIAADSLNEASGFQFDDKRFLTVDVRPRIQVVCIEGFAGAAKSFMAATEPVSTESVSDSALPVIASTIIPQSQLSMLKSDTNEPIDVIALFGCGSLGEAERKKLTEFVSSGIAVMLSLGPETDVESWNQWFEMLEPASRSTRSSPASIRLRPDVVEGDFRLNPLEYQHPLIQEFRKQPQAGITDAPVFRYRKIESSLPNEDSILGFDNGDPAWVAWRPKLAEGRIGRPILISTTPVHTLADDSAWNRLPAWWSYVPLVNKATVWLFGMASDRAPLLCGQVYPLPINHSGFASSVQVLDSSNAPKELPLVALDPSESSIERQCVELRSNVPGFLRVNVNEVDETAVAFNTSSLESEQSRANLVEIQNSFAVRQTDTQKIERSNSSIPLRSREFYLLALSLVAVLLLIEPLLANRRSHRSARPQSSEGLR